MVQEYKESYEILINVLDEIVKIFKDENITINQYSNILKQGLKASSLGKNTRNTRPGNNGRCR